jgi:hypothetical protein
MLCLCALAQHMHRFIHSSTDEFARGTPDEEWLPRLGLRQQCLFLIEAPRLRREQRLRFG